jgi:hypothetical protein
MCLFGCLCLKLICFIMLSSKAQLNVKVVDGLLCQIYVLYVVAVLLSKSKTYWW